MRPIPVEVIPSHAYLSAQDQAELFGVGYAMTIAEEHTQPGQYVYNETLEVMGRLKRSIRVRVLGPNWDRTHIEVTPTEAVFLGLRLEEVKSGDLRGAGPCHLIGPEGEIRLNAGIIVPRPHLLCSPYDAATLHITNGQEVALELSGKNRAVIENVLVRVHPAFRLRAEVHQGYARDLWITRQEHARIRE